MFKLLRYLLLICLVLPPAAGPRAAEAVQDCYIAINTKKPLVRTSYRAESIEKILDEYKGIIKKDYPSSGEDYWDRQAKGKLGEQEGTKMR